MAKARLMTPIAELRGKLKMNDKVYVRTAWGHCVMQRVLRILSEKRRAACEAFGRIYGTNKKKIASE